MILLGQGARAGCGRVWCCIIQFILSELHPFPGRRWKFAAGVCVRLGKEKENHKILGNGAVRRAVGDEGCGVIIIILVTLFSPRVQGGPSCPGKAWKGSVRAQETPGCPATLSTNPCCAFGLLQPRFPISLMAPMNNSGGVFDPATSPAQEVTGVRSCCSQKRPKNPIQAFFSPPIWRLQEPAGPGCWI